MYYIKEFLWFFRKTVNRFILWRRLKKHYMAPWDITDTLLYFCFETFRMFYEKSGLDNYVYWGDPNDFDNYPEEEHFEGEKQFLAERWVIRQEIGRLYFWWTILRPKHLDRMEYLYSYCSVKYPLKFIKNDNNTHTLDTTDKSKDRKKVFKKINDIESMLLDIDKKNLQSLISIKDYLWT